MTEQPTVLHLCSIKGRGGTGYMAGTLARRSAEAGARVLVGACPGSKMEERTREAGLETLDGLHLRRGFHPFFLVGDLRRIRRCLHTCAVDIVHTWHSIEYWTAAVALLGERAKLVRTRGIMTPVRGTAVNRWIHGRTAFVHVTCRRIEAMYHESGLAPDRVRLIHAGVDLQRFTPRTPGAVLRESFGIPSGVPVVASIGRLEAVKGHVHLLEALARLRGQDLSFRVLVAGDGSLRASLEARARELGLSDRVRFLGVRDDIPAILAACNVYVLTSIGSEGSSRATLEAMASGLPVVASDVGMLPDIVKDGSNGYLVPPGDPDALARRLRPLLLDRGLRNAMGLNARILMEEGFGEQAFAETMLDRYRTALGWTGR